MTASTKTIGLLCADSSDLYLAKALYLLERKLSEHGYQSLLCATGYTFQRKKESLKFILSKKWMRSFSSVRILSALTPKKTNI